MGIADILIQNERDSRVLSWLRSIYTDDEIEIALSCLAGQRRPYVSNVCKLFGVVPPENIG